METTREKRGRAYAARRRRRRSLGAASVAAALLVAVAAAVYLTGGGTFGTTLGTAQAGPERPPAGGGGGEKAAVGPEERAGAGEGTKGAGPGEEAGGQEEMQVFGEYQTDFLWDSNPNRKENMKLAAGAVDGTVLEPGETFSFNDLTRGLDYEAAKTFSDGGVGYANGGGLCQVSSTLYMAAQYAGLEIVERNPHYAVLPYIRPGFDATVWFGGDGIPELDMRFENTTGGDVVVREWVDEEGFLNARILGEEPTGREVEMRSEKVFEDPARGIKWATYKKVTKDGEVLFDGLLHKDVYGYNPPVPEGMPHYDTAKPRVGGWPDPNNTTGWADVE